jgi:hypothetical protein
MGVRADAIFIARTRFLPRLRVMPRPGVNADAGGRPDEKDVRTNIFHPKTSVMTSLLIPNLQCHTCESGKKKPFMKPSSNHFFSNKHTNITYIAIVEKMSMSYF